MDVRLAALLRGARAGKDGLVARLTRTPSPIHAWVALPGPDGLCHAVRVVEGHLFVGVGVRRTRWVSAHRALTQERAKCWGQWGFWHRSPHEHMFKKPSKRIDDRKWRHEEYWCGEPAIEEDR